MFSLIGDITQNIIRTLSRLWKKAGNVGVWAVLLLMRFVLWKGVMFGNFIRIISGCERVTEKERDKIKL